MTAGQLLPRGLVARLGGGGTSRAASKRPQAGPGREDSNTMSDTVNQQTTPFERLGGADRVRSIGERFYEVMDADEPALAAVHKLDATGRVSREARDRFILFFIGWLGGPQDYVVQHGHPRLRGRHASVRESRRAGLKIRWGNSRVGSSPSASDPDHVVARTARRGQVDAHERGRG